MFDFAKLTTGKKIAKILLWAAGLALVVYAVVVLAMDAALNGSIVARNGLTESNNENRRVIATGRLSCSGTAEDPVFRVTADAMALYRRVEMVQYVEDKETGAARLVFSDRQEPNFTDKNGRQYTNPKFPSVIENKCFSAGTVIGDGSIGVSADLLKDLLTKSGCVEEPVKAEKITDLPELRNRDDLENYGDFYATPGGEWQAGDLRVTFFSFNADPKKEYTVAGVQFDGVLQDRGADCALWDRVLTDDEIKSLYGDLRTTAGLIALVCGIGLLLIGTGVGASFMMPWEKKRKVRGVRR